MLNLKQTKTLIDTTLNAIDLGGPIAVNLILGTMLQESSLSFLKQIGGGPAISLCMIEPFTFMDIRHHLLAHPDLYKKILITCHLSEIPDDPQILMGNISLAIIFCRLKYYFSPEPLPANNALILAQWYKKIYNSPKGAATIEQATKNMQIAISCI